MYRFALCHDQPQDFEGFSAFAAATLARAALDSRPPSRHEEQGGFAHRSDCTAVWVPEIRHLAVHEGCHAEMMRGWPREIQAVFHTVTNTCIGWINFTREDTNEVNDH